jgi:hypothetical protein
VDIDWTSRVSPTRDGTAFTWSTCGPKKSKSEWELRRRQLSASSLLRFITKTMLATKKEAGHDSPSYQK